MHEEKKITFCFNKFVFEKKTKINKIFAPRLIQTLPLISYDDFYQKCGLSYQTLMEKKVLFDFSLALSGLKLTPALVADESTLLSVRDANKTNTHSLKQTLSLSLPLTNTNKSSTHLHTLFHSILNTPTKRSLHTLFSTHSHTLLHHHLTHTHTHTRCTLTRTFTHARTYLRRARVKKSEKL